MILRARPDSRLEPNVLVLGVTVNGESRAYPLDELYSTSPALNEVIGGQPIVVFSQPGSLLTMAFSRVVDERVLSLEAAGHMRFRDTETGSEWDIEGKAIVGPLAGKRLNFVTSRVEEWYEFAATMSDVEICGSKPKHEIDPQPHLNRDSRL